VCEPTQEGITTVVVGKAGVEHRLFLDLDHGVVFAFVVVAQTEFFMVCLPLMAASSTGVADFSVTVSSNEAQRILI
jgi:hypothetical protein